MAATGYPGAGWSFPKPPRFPQLRRLGFYSVGFLAAFLGHLLRGAGIVGKLFAAVGPGLAGSAAIIYGASLIYPPAGWLAAGAFLLLLDRRS